MKLGELRRITNDLSDDVDVFACSIEERDDATANALDVCDAVITDDGENVIIFSVANVTDEED